MWGDFVCETVERVLRQPIEKILRNVAAVVGVGAGLAALDGDTAVRVCAGHVRGEVQIEKCIPEGKPSDVSLEGVGPTARIL